MVVKFNIGTTNARLCEKNDSTWSIGIISYCSVLPKSRVEAYWKGGSWVEPGPAPFPHQRKSVLKAYIGPISLKRAVENTGMLSSFYYVLLVLYNRLREFRMRDYGRGCVMRSG